MARFFSLWLLVALSFISVLATAAQEAPMGPQVDVASSADGHVSLGQKLWFTRAADPALGIEQILQQQHAIEWRASDVAVPNLGMTDDVYWFYAELENTAEDPATRFLEVSYPLIDFLDIYLVEDGEVVQTVRTGDQRPMESRAIAHRNFLVQLEFPPESEQHLYFRVQTEGALQLPVELWQVDAFMEQDQAAFGLQAAFAGIMLALAIYNFLILLTLRDPSYLWYVLNVVAIAIVQLSLHGVTFQYLWPNLPQLNNIVLVGSITLSISFTSLFTYTFLNIRRQGLVARSFVLGLAAVAGVVFFYALFAPYEVTIKLAVLLVGIGAPGMLVLGIYLWAKGDVLARFYTIAWSFVLLGNTLLALNKIAVLPRNTYFEYGPQVGAALEVLLLSFALGYRINLERRQRFAAQAEVLAAERAARESNERALHIQQEANEKLEERVSERTIKLESAVRKLQEMTAIDGLTQVKNRHFFDRVLEHEWARNARESTQMSLLMLDVDHFKQVNDDFGHLGGDACLQHLARVYQECVHRAADFVARYGGEEFVILMSHTTLEGAAVVAERIRKKVEETPLVWQGRTLNPTVSIGVACVIPTPFEDRKTLVEHADRALYEAKNTGRNRVKVYRSISAEAVP